MKVQRVLHRKSNKDDFLPAGRIINEERYPLRGLLLCPKCNSTLTASSAKGRSKHYYYYHCTTSCGFRHNSEIVNDLFVEELSKFRFSIGAEKILKTILEQNFLIVSNGLNDERKVLQNKLNAIEGRIDKARDMYLEDKLDEEDFKRIKMKYKVEIEDINFKLNSLKNSGHTDDIEKKLSKALNAIVNISERYNNASTIDKRAIVGLIYPEKLTFDGEYFQTTKINSLAGNIALINKELGNKKNRQRSEKTSNVGLVTLTGLSSNTFIDDLIRLSQIKQELQSPFLLNNFF
ncbi:zinc ribbon domain-containing protein [Epilithonimonas sp. JDS]|nr:zinc ribbon domain-containing protein [Epilithonimonas sp. JDS]MCD9855506.1 zinc ribbon domain-containing protein [Epilithonimonas sp. JDS]